MGTSALSSHLTSQQHVEKWKELLKPNPITKLFKPKTPQDICDSAVLKFLIENNIAFNAVDSSSFKDMLGTFHRNTNPTSSTTLKGLLDNKYDSMQRQVLEFVSNLEFGKKSNTSRQGRIPPNDSLRWWSLNEGRFPQLARVARAVFCIPMADAEVERVFRAGLIVTKRRNRLKSQQVSKILFVKRNLALQK